MSRNCEVKLVDVMLAKRNKRTKAHEFDKTSQPQTNKEFMFKNKTVLKNKELNKHSNVESKNVEEKSTRSSKRLINSNVVSELNKVLNSKKNIQMIGNVLQSVLPEKDIRKRKLSASEIENVTSNKKLDVKHFITISNACIQSSVSTNVSNQQIKKKRRSRRNRKSFWESKLTGARRVSKRLRNMKIKHDTLKSLEVQIERYCHSNKKEEEKVKCKIEKTSKATKIKQHKYRKNIEPETSRSILYRVPHKEETNYRNLNHKKKFHPRVNTFKETSQISSEDLKSDLNESLNIPNLHVDTVNKLSSRNKNRTTNQITQNVPDTILFTEKDKGSETKAQPQERVKREPIDSVTLKMDQLHEESDVNLVQSDEVECSHNHLTDADENNDQSVYDEQEDCVNCSEVIIIDIKSNESEHFEECEFTQNLDYHVQIKEDSLERVTSSENNVGQQILDTTMPSKSSESSDNICQETEAKSENFGNSNDSSTKPNPSMQENNIQNECIKSMAIDESIDKSMSVAVDDCIDEVGSNPTET
uniref:Uncharacterized protein n=1 Tax=Graphocephala atropunctata TaxID=36148 RepID=A0A1B6LNI1_9HEMI